MATAVGLPWRRPTATAAGGAHRAAASSWGAAAAQLACGVLLLSGQWAFVFGAAWDIQWHLVVGRDRPLTPPHVLLLAGIAITGLVALAGVLGFTLAARRRPAGMELASALDAEAVAGAPGNVIGAAQRPDRRQFVRLLGVFEAPLGCYVAGLGALLAAIAFPLDDLWHRLYGLDATIWAPFHVMIIAAMALAALGTTWVFASLANAAYACRNAPPASGRGDERAEVSGADTPDPAAPAPAWMWPVASVGLALGLAAVAATLLIALAQTLDREGIMRLGGTRPVAVFPPLLALLALPWVVAGAPAVRFPGGATLVAAGVTLARLALFAFVPWAVEATAAAEGLTVRSNAVPFVATPLAFPAWLLVCGAAIDLVWWLTRSWRRRWWLPAWPLLVGAGTASALVLALLDRPWMQTVPLTRSWRGIDAPAALVASLPWVVACGFVAALVGIGLGASLRQART